MGTLKLLLDEMVAAVRQERSLHHRRRCELPSPLPIVRDVARLSRSFREGGESRDTDAEEKRVSNGETPERKSPHV